MKSFDLVSLRKRSRHDTWDSKENFRPEIHVHLGTLTPAGAAPASSSSTPLQTSTRHSNVKAEPVVIDLATDDGDTVVKVESPEYNLDLKEEQEEFDEEDEDGL